VRFRKKPVVIEAVQITDATFDWPHPNPEHVAGVVYDPVNREARIRTLEGEMIGRVGDWIITGVKGEVYPCKPDIFAATYEPEGELTITGVNGEGCLTTTYEPKEPTALELGAAARRIC
jgi:hypothetical protein